MLTCRVAKEGALAFKRVFSSQNDNDVGHLSGVSEGNPTFAAKMTSRMATNELSDRGTVDWGAGFNVHVGVNQFLSGCKSEGEQLRDMILGWFKTQFADPVSTVIE